MIGESNSLGHTDEQWRDLVLILFGFGRRHSDDSHRGLTIEEAGEQRENCRVLPKSAPRRR